MSEKRIASKTFYVERRRDVTYRFRLYPYNFWAKQWDDVVLDVLAELQKLGWPWISKDDLRVESNTAGLHFQCWVNVSEEDEKRIESLLKLNGWKQSKGN